ESRHEHALCAAAARDDRHVVHRIRSRAAAAVGAAVAARSEKPMAEDQRHRRQRRLCRYFVFQSGIPSPIRSDPARRARGARRGRTPNRDGHRRIGWAYAALVRANLRISPRHRPGHVRIACRGAGRPSSTSAVKSPAWRFVMVLAINDTAPDFEAETTVGKLRLHDWIGDKWAVLFSHPKDYTPVCTTELGYMAKIKPEFDKRGVNIIGLSVDPVSQHVGWANDIKETQGFAPNYPMIGDVDYKVSKLYGMLPASVSGDPAKRTPADNQTVRNAFVIGPDKKIKLILVYPMTTGRNFDE